MHTQFLSRNLNGRGNSEYVGNDGRAMLIGILGNRSVVVDWILLACFVTTHVGPDASASVPNL
jgi:hypothetical protein